MMDVIKRVLSFLDRTLSRSYHSASMNIDELKKEVKEATEDLLKGNGIRHKDFMKEKKSELQTR